MDRFRVAMSAYPKIIMAIAYLTFGCHCVASAAAAAAIVGCFGPMFGSSIPHAASLNVTLRVAVALLGLGVVAVWVFHNRPSIWVAVILGVVAYCGSFMPVVQHASKLRREELFDTLGWGWWCIAAGSFVAILALVFPPVFRSLSFKYMEAYIGKHDG